MPDIRFHYSEQTSLHQCQFQAMASPCQVIIEAPKDFNPQTLYKQVSEEAWRIEKKFSRYRDDNLLYRINQHEKCELDSETLSLLDFAQQCYELSDGLFDVTSGVLRKVWNFKTLKSLPSQQSVDALLPFIGFNKVIRQGNTIELPEGMSLDLGGINKEYAVHKY